MMPLSDKFKNLLSFAILLVVGIIFFRPMLFEGHILFDRDFSQGTYPTRFYIFQAFHQGFVPNWIHAIYSGAPFFAKLHPGVFYPPSVVFFLNSFPLALNLFYLFHFLLIMFSTYFLVRSWDVSVTGTLASTLTATFSAYLISTTLVSNLFLATVWGPAVILCFQNYVKGGKALFLMLTIFTLACQTLAGNPETSILTCALALLFPLFCFREPEMRSTYLKRIAMVFPAVVLSLGLVAFQLIPTYKLIKHSDRHGGMSYERHTTFSLSQEMIKSFFLPTNVEDAYNQKLTKGDSQSLLLETIHVGLFPALFLILSIRFLEQRTIRFWFVVFWVGVFFAMGRYNPLYPFFYDWMPLLKTFRYPEKFFFVSVMALIFLVGLVWDSLFHSTVKRAGILKYFQGSILLVAGIVGWSALGRPMANPGLSLLILLIFSLFYLFLYFQKVRPLQFKMIFLLLLIMELWFHHVPYLYLIDKNYYKTEPMLLEEIKKDPELVRTYSGRIRGNPSRFLLPNGPTRLAALQAMKEYMYPYLGIIYGIESADGMARFGFGLKYQNEWYDRFVGVSPEQRFTILKRNNVRYWINVDPPTPYINNIPLIFPDRVVKLEGALPRAFMVPRARVVEPGKVLDVYYDQNFDPRAEVLLSTPETFLPSENFEGEVDSIVYGPNRVSLRTHQNSHGYLVLLDSYFPGWTVTVDGQPGHILRANHFFRAVALGPGEHQLDFEFTPEGWTLGWRVSGASLGVILLVALWTRRRALAEALKSPPSPENAST